MHLTMNGQDIEIIENSSVLDLLKKRNLDEQTVVVEYNFNVLAREKFKQTILQENDNLEVLRFVGGG